MKTVLQYLRPQYARLALQLTIKFIGTITELFLPWMLSLILDDVVPQKDMPQVYLWGIFMQKVGEQDEKKEAHLKAWCKNAERQHSALMDTLEKELNYSVVPIRKLVSIQLACGLLVSDYLKDKNIV